MKKLRTAPQILEHYCSDMDLFNYQECMLKAMRCYAKYKSDIAYEKGFQNALKMFDMKG